MSTTLFYTLSLHDALPIFRWALSLISRHFWRACWTSMLQLKARVKLKHRCPTRSEEHTSELQSLAYLLCRLLLQKKKKRRTKLQNRTHNDVRSDLHSPGPL